MLSVTEALEQILDGVAPRVGREQCALMEASGRVLAEAIVSPLDVPPWDNSAMDGYALRAADLAADGDSLNISLRVPAGAEPGELKPGTAARIFTGAPVPAGADAVAMQENCEGLDEGAGVRFLKAVEPGQNIRPRGQDIAAGATIMEAGKRLSPMDIGLIASVGLAEVPVYKRLRVGLISTGDELIEPGREAGPGEIYNSNRYGIGALLTAYGAELVDGGILEDDREATEKQLAELAAKTDLVISSGGVSVGEEDYVKAAVDKLGRLRLWKIAIKPGKPLAFGSIGETPFFGLPGNPVSAFVTFLLFARPWLLTAQGRAHVHPLQVTARAAFTRPQAATRCEYLRARVFAGEAEFTGEAAAADGKNEEARLWAEPFGNQSSGVLSSMSWANALAVVPPGTTVAEGDPVPVLLFSELLA